MRSGVPGLPSGGCASRPRERRPTRRPPRGAQPGARPGPAGGNPGGCGAPTRGRTETGPGRGTRTGRPAGEAGRREVPARRGGCAGAGRCAGPPSLLPPCLRPAALPSEGAGDPSGRGVPACPEHRAERGRAGSAQRGPGSPRRCAPAVPAPRPSHRGREVPVRRRSRVTWASAALPKIPEKREFITSLEHRKQELAEICFA